MARSKAARYAVLAVVEIAKRSYEHEGLRAKDVCEIFGVPRAYVAKVLTQLARAGILYSERGPRGGFFLGREACDINFLEVIEAVDGTLTPEPPIHSLSGGKHIDASLNDLFDQSLRQMREYLRVSTVADFLGRLECSESASPRSSPKRGSQARVQYG